MIAVNIGRRLLAAYNDREGQKLSPKDFFEIIYVPLFFDHPRYLMSGGNSPLENPKIQWKKGKFPSKEDRASRIKKTMEKLESVSTLDASTAIGFPASDVKEFGTTSGQVTSIDLAQSADEAYLSWIGSGLGIGVAGGLSIFFDHPKILLDLFDGWKVYRDYLNDVAYNLRGNQINTWNGQWLAHIYDKHFDSESPLEEFSNKAFQVNKDGGMEVKTQSWTQLMIGISVKFKGLDNLTGYVYSLGQMNITIGFIPFQLPQIRKPAQLYAKLFGESEYLKDATKSEALYGTAFGFRRACQMGSIGIQAMEPKDLGKFVPSAKSEGKMPNYAKADHETIVTFRTYQTWILAMLNNEQLWETAGKAAQAFLDFEKGAGKGKTDRGNQVKAVLKGHRKNQVIEELKNLVEKPDSPDGIVELGKTIHHMPADNVAYFMTLIRFRYAELSNNKKQEA